MKWRICCMICHIQVKSLFYNGFNIAKYTPTYIFCGVLSVVSWQHLDDYLYTYFICCFSFVAFCLFRKKNENEEKIDKQINEQLPTMRRGSRRKPWWTSFVRWRRWGWKFGGTGPGSWGWAWTRSSGGTGMSINATRFFWGGRTHKNDDFEGFFRFA